jgi:hypothetical protein
MVCQTSTMNGSSSPITVCQPLPWAVAQAVSLRRKRVSAFTDVGYGSCSGAGSGAPSWRRWQNRQLLHRMASARGHQAMVGSVEQVADRIEVWFTQGVRPTASTSCRPICPVGWKTLSTAWYPSCRLAACSAESTKAVRCIDNMISRGREVNIRRRMLCSTDRLVELPYPRRLAIKFRFRTRPYGP